MFFAVFVVRLSIRRLRVRPPSTSLTKALVFLVNARAFSFESPLKGKVNPPFLEVLLFVMDAASTYADVCFTSSIAMARIVMQKDLTIHRLLLKMSEVEASDLHIKIGSPPMHPEQLRSRVHGIAVKSDGLISRIRRPFNEQS